LALISSASQFRQTQIRNHNQVAKTFEKVVLHAVERYVGGSAVRVGHPREAPAPRSFADLLEYLAKRLGEGLRRARPLVEETKDCRADIVAWRSFADRRGGQLVLFTQCALGTNWTTKITELDIKLWERYIEFVVTPLRAFAIPFIEPEAGRWLQYGTLGGIAFDRLRIVEMLAGDRLPRPLLGELRTWSTQQMRRLPWDE
jgi:hypothetical protein